MMKVLITVKTYPNLSTKYDELVCTAGFREDGSWIRIFPVPFRKLSIDDRYKKYDWIEVDLVKNRSDFRPESYRPKSLSSEFKILSHLESSKDQWKARKETVLQNVYTNLTKLIAEAKDRKICTSLAVFKPKKVIELKIEKTSSEWDAKKLDKLKEKAKQMDLFKNSDKNFEVVKKLPYKFSYTFIDEDDRQSTLMIEDWEIGMLYWNSLKRKEWDETKACEDVRKKYFEDFALTKDLYLFLGTTQLHHLRAPNPFVIIGTFHPPFILSKESPQQSLFD